MSNTNFFIRQGFNNALVLFQNNKASPPESKKLDVALSFSLLILINSRKLKLALLYCYLRYVFVRISLRAFRLIPKTPNAPQFSQTNLFGTYLNQLQVFEAFPLWYVSHGQKLLSTLDVKANV